LIVRKERKSTRAEPAPPPKWRIAISPVRIQTTIRCSLDLRLGGE
jgi:hypothetical protein